MITEESLGPLIISDGTCRAARSLILHDPRSLILWWIRSVIVLALIIFNPCSSEFDCACRAARPTVITEESLGPASLAAVSNSRFLLFLLKVFVLWFVGLLLWRFNFRDPIPVRDDKVKEEVKEKGFTKHKGGKPSPRYLFSYCNVLLRFQW